ncbi:DUF5085 family protein [Alkaliphilus hydrothermalis]|uniref:Effector-binding domain-containing protein n=1 Tax=Alkaliphilus hydrothermalis TaxID=1482730 RepID=A0ABS2NQ27_9FIRM|nr:DUF5085 family protein [Alkaliphilus hydrothermalis]MBM7615048.1 effector-binding domain-containing protein [Alkaliphilus hydrothermalis]
MINIETGKELKLENVLSLRKKMTEMDVHQEMVKIGKFIEDNGIVKTGPVITATFTVEQANGQQLLDMEILVPINKKIGNIGGYKTKDIFHLVNAIYARHHGNPNLLQNVYQEMIGYMQRNNLQQITPGYNAGPGDRLSVPLFCINFKTSVINYAK